MWIVLSFRMPRRSAHAPLTALGVALACAAIHLSLLLLACDRCGFGGPGCSASRIQGACGASVLVGRPTEIRFVFSDDAIRAGEANVTAFTMDAPSPVEVTRLSRGRFVLMPSAAGPMTIRARIEGWERTQRFEIQAVSSLPLADAGETGGADAGIRCDDVRGIDE